MRAEDIEIELPDYAAKVERLVLGPFPELLASKPSNY
jgi:hypothetical protein